MKKKGTATMKKGTDQTMTRPSAGDAFLSAAYFTKTRALMEKERDAVGVQLLNLFEEKFGRAIAGTPMLH